MSAAYEPVQPTSRLPVLSVQNTTMTATPTATFITDQNVIKEFNRGSITTVFTPPPSCTETITSATGALFVGHYRLDFDQECYPRASNPSEAPAPSSGWDAYYCARVVTESDIPTNAA